MKTPINSKIQRLTNISENEFNDNQEVPCTPTAKDPNPQDEMVPDLAGIGYSYLIGTIMAHIIIIILILAVQFNNRCLAFAGTLYVSIIIFYDIVTSWLRRMIRGLFITLILILKLYNFILYPNKRRSKQQYMPNLIPHTSKRAKNKLYNPSTARPKSSNPQNAVYSPIPNTPKNLKVISIVLYLISHLFLLEV